MIVKIRPIEQWCEAMRSVERFHALVGMKLEVSDVVSLHTGLDRQHDEPCRWRYLTSGSIDDVERVIGAELENSRFRSPAICEHIFQEVRQ